MKHPKAVTRRANITQGQADKAVRDYLRHRSDDDWYEDPEVFFGFGSVHDLRDADSKPPRLAGLHSVNQHDLNLKPRPRMRKHRCGFHIPKVRR